MKKSTDSRNMQLRCFFVFVILLQKKTSERFSLSLAYDNNIMLIFQRKWKFVVYFWTSLGIFWTWHFWSNRPEVHPNFPYRIYFPYFTNLRTSL